MEYFSRYFENDGIYMVTNQYSWILLGTSVVAEVLGTVFLKLSNGFSQVLLTALTIICYLVAIWLMAVATKNIELSTAYAIWAGASTSLVVIVGIAWFDESSTPFKLLGLAMAISSIVLLNLSTRPP